uniref:Pentatricopeptide repeat-containing protein n=1 Tax=Aegilops tauschii TaxID=37682 RepID=M8BUJ5_AEGTA
MAGHLAKNPFLLLLQPRRLCTAAASSSAAAGELAPSPVVEEIPRDADLAEEARSRLVRDTCKLLELRGSWTPKLEAQLRHLLRVLSPPQVRAVLRAQAQTDARAAFEFFRWADRQWRYRHALEAFDEMLSLLSHTRLHDPARHVMRLMIRRRMRRRTQQFAHLMLSYSCAGKLRSAMRVLQLMQKDGCAPDISICNVAVNVLVFAGCIDKALEFSDRMRRVGVELDVVTYNCLIKGLCSVRRVVEALEMIGEEVAEVRGLLRRMRNDAGLFPDQVTYNMLIHVLAKHGHADEALEFLRESEGKRFRVDGHAVVHSFCLNGRMAEAKEIVSEMISKECHPDVVTYSAVVDGFCRIGEIDQARKMMKHMYKNGCKPNIVRHTALLNGLCKAGKTSEARELLNNSAEEWWTPSDITYSVVMHGFRREGKLKESCDVVTQMLQKGFFPTTVESNLLIHASCLHSSRTRRVRTLKVL